MRLIFYHIQVPWFFGSLVKGYCYQDRFEHKKKMVTFGLIALFPSFSLLLRHLNIPWGPSGPGPGTCRQKRILQSCGIERPESAVADQKQILQPSQVQRLTPSPSLLSLCLSLSHFGWRSPVYYSRFDSYAAGRIQGWVDENTAGHMKTQLWALLWDLVTSPLFLVSKVKLFLQRSVHLMEYFRDSTQKLLKMAAACKVELL